MLPKINPTSTKAWKKLNQHQKELAKQHLTEYFQADPERAQRYQLELGDLLFDFSKHHFTEETLDLLEELFEECQLEEALKDQRKGAPINETEDRAVLHTALRNKSGPNLEIAGEEIRPQIEEVLEQMHDFSDLVISGNWKGYSGKTIKHVVNIGIGGSDLGPAMVYQALYPYRNHLKCHFVSNVDSTDLLDVLDHLNPEHTLFIIASKTFTTQETMSNAQSARAWFLRNSEATEGDIAKHFVAVSTNQQKVEEFGINPSNMFVFWDWVGGRYSVWSAIGLSLCCSLGYRNFEKLLQGAERMDQHFYEKPFRRNIPKMMAALGIWYRNFWNAGSEVIVPYAQHLQRFTAYFQQGNMESNGKSIDRSGQLVNYPTGPIVWGEPGTNGQHAFFQLLHQGTDLIPADFIGFACSHRELRDHQPKLLANFLAQTEALMQGKSENAVRKEMEEQGYTADEITALSPYRAFPGNKPSTSILGKQLSPEALGRLMAAYEHKILVQGIVWNIYSFDQWGVELGKQMAKPLIQQIMKPEESTLTELHPSTQALLKAIHKWRKKV